VSTFARVARTVRFIVARRLYLPRYLVYLARFLWLKISKPHIVTEGFVFMGPRVELYARRGYGRLVLGRWVVIGEGNAIRCHEGNVRIGDKVVFGQNNTINAYLDVSIGDDCLLADSIYICDFDHRFEDLDMPIRKQGVVSSPVEIGRDCWIGEKATILRGVTVGEGSVIASHALVNRDVPARAIVGGVPARVLKKRDEGQRG
jgi:acetyltransferase-like isoleucine patch superfamily enzyme